MIWGYIFEKVELNVTNLKHGANYAVGHFQQGVYVLISGFFILNLINDSRDLTPNLLWR
jgi:hypothetical protein